MLKNLKWWFVVYPLYPLTAIAWCAACVLGELYFCAARWANGSPVPPLEWKCLGYTLTWKSNNSPKE